MITKKDLKQMDFTKFGKVWIKELSNSDCLVAIKRPNKKYLVRSVLSGHDKPFEYTDDLISFLSYIGQLGFCEVIYTYKKRNDKSNRR